MVESSVPELIRETGMSLVTDRFVRQGFYPSRVLIAENVAVQKRAAHGSSKYGQAARNRCALAGLQFASFEVLLVLSNTSPFIDSYQWSAIERNY